MRPVSRDRVNRYGWVGVNEDHFNRAITGDAGAALCSAQDILIEIGSAIRYVGGIDEDAPPAVRLSYIQNLAVCSREIAANLPTDCRDQFLRIASICDTAAEMALRNARSAQHAYDFDYGKVALDSLRHIKREVFDDLITLAAKLQTLAANSMPMLASDVPLKGVRSHPLSSNQAIVLSVLQTGVTVTLDSAVELSRKAGGPRSKSTVHTILAQLEERGEVVRGKNGYGFARKPTRASANRNEIGT